VTAVFYLFICLFKSFTAHLFKREMELDLERWIRDGCNYPELDVK